jgi:ubiquinone biosynthesis monooxygenase Coq6
LNAALLSDPGVGLNPAVLEDAATRSIRSLATEDLSSFPPVVKSIDSRSIASFPLKLTHAESYIGNRTALVGDAAHTIHPLAGQGLNMGLGDVRVLADVWEETVCKGGDLGESDDG